MIPKFDFIYIQHFLAFGGSKKCFYLCIVKVAIDTYRFVLLSGFKPTRYGIPWLAQHDLGIPLFYPRVFDKTRWNTMG